MPPIPPPRPQRKKKLYDGTLQPRHVHQTVKSKIFLFAVTLELRSTVKVLPKEGDRR